MIHEKPFAGINGSGKHCNWAVSADGKNLLEPGDDPASNLQFLLTVACVVRAVDKYAEALRVSVASASNDHRLGANEAPPAIISIFLGDTLEKVVTEIAKGKSLEIQEKKKINLFKERGIDLGIKAMPSIPAHDTDRNRTSPFAFTGNKFEFRALGSAQNPSSPNFTLNTIVADSMDYISEEIEHKLAAKKSLSSAVESVIREVFKKHSRIIFNGDNYSESWVKEAKKRGLPNLRQSVEAFEIYTRKDIVDLFEKYNVLSKKLIELEALTYIRGRSIPNRFILIDEAQNLTPHEIKTIITRVGENSKIVLTGDPYQIDNPFVDTYSNGLSYVMEKMKNSALAGYVFLVKGERSELAELASNLL